MEFICDFHIHSKYSRAVSKDMAPENLDKWAKIKGIHILGIGDFTHPAWFKEIKQKLEPAEPGLFVLKKQYRLDSPGKLRVPRSSDDAGEVKDGAGISEPRFILTTEISSIYTKNNKGRRVHNLIFMPSIEAVEKLNAHLNMIGNLKSDGRPILGLDSKELLKICLNVAGEEMFFVPAHAWTPWFSVFGSKSGFNSIEECFDEYSSNIYAIETGLSSDPAMNWRLSKLDNISLISNSDSHSLMRLGRESNVLNIDSKNLSYNSIINTIKSGDPSSFLGTVEFFPEEGKYHFDGHRLCKVSMNPSESKKHNSRCPKCSKPVTLGVLYRVEELADRDDGFIPKERVPFKNMVPLDQIIADALGMGTNTKAVWNKYKELIDYFHNEFHVQFKASEEQLRSITIPEIAEAIIRVRNGKLHIAPGYDGEFGKIEIFTAEERSSISKQAVLF